MRRTIAQSRLPDTRERATPGQSQAVQSGECALTETIIADLPTRLISLMSRDELIRVIRAAGVPFLRPGTLLRLRYLDRQTLERLAFLSRRCCGNRCRAD